MPRTLFSPWVPTPFTGGFVRTDRANAYVLGTTAPTAPKIGQLWADTSGDVVIKCYTADGWVDIEQIENSLEFLGRGTQTTTSTSNTNLLSISGTIFMEQNLFIEINFASSGTGYGRIGLNAHGTLVNSAAADGTCIARDEVALRGGTCHVIIPRRDHSFVTSHGIAYSTLSATHSIANIGLSAVPPAADWTSFQLTGACSAATTTLWATWSVFSWL